MTGTSYPSNLVASATSGGVLHFSTLLVAGATYNLCETVMPSRERNVADVESGEDVSEPVDAAMISRISPGLISVS